MAHRNKINDGEDETSGSQGDINIIGDNGEIEGRYIEDLSEESEEEIFQRDQRKSLYKLQKAYVPGSAVCSVKGCKRSKDIPLFIGEDGKYYCRDHILPENVGRTAKGKPPMDRVLVYRSDGKIETKK